VRILRGGGIILGGTDEPLGLNDWGLQPTLAGFVKFGFTPYEALRTVTALPAKVMGLEEDLGTVGRGRLADLCFVRGNPLEKIHDAFDVTMVMKNGRLYTRDELIEPYADVSLNRPGAKAAARRGRAVADPRGYSPPPDDPTGGHC
jgi:imidazolonepropionase-like amidohydrolase